MNFRSYDILTQLIPGTLYLGGVSIITNTDLSLEGLKILSLATLTMIAFVIGYVINTVSHFLEGLIFSGINWRVTRTCKEKQIKGIFLLMKTFTKLKYIQLENAKKHKLSKEFYKSIYMRVFASLDDKSKQKLKWTNEDIKFARVLLTCCLLFIISAIWVHLNVSLSQYIRESVLVTIILFFIALYRYLQNKIDYVYKVMDMGNSKPIN